MPDFTTLLQGGNAWLFIPSAIVLGALHGLEPGHSKTMMAAFIVAVRGTVWQAMLLGLAATISHTAIVWIIALAGLYFGSQFNTAATEPYLQLVSAALIIGVALWMFWRMRRTGAAAASSRSRHDDHGHDHDHGHAHDDGVADGDAHERAHAAAISRRFAGQQTVTTGQIVTFGLTGGLIPCPASITVLLLCLQLKKFALGATLVLGFSIGLAVTMVAVGAAAALSVRHVSRRWPGFEGFARTAPYFSSLLMIAVGLYTGYLGVAGLPGHTS